MTTISARVIADSISPSGVRLTTLACRYPWIIHPEVMTHRVFSRSASSMRAIPTKRLIEDIEHDAYVPLEFRKAAKGMEPGDELNESDREQAETRWYWAMHDAIRHARQLSQIGLSKGHANRILAPFAHINCLITSTCWDNFFDLRLAINPETGRPVAQVEMFRLADEIRAALNGYVGPWRCRPGDWHTPYAPDGLPEDKRVKVSAARCARVSYLTHDDREPSVEEDLGLYERLVSQGHMSPLEHQARAVDYRAHPWLRRNFSDGWEQHRAHVENKAPSSIFT